MLLNLMKPYESCVCVFLRNKTTLCFDFLHSFMVGAQIYAFLVQGPHKNVIFMLSRFIFVCRLVLYLYACAVENPENFKILCI